MEHPEDQKPPARGDRGHALRSGLLAAGAAFGMTLAGLGIASAQTGAQTGDQTDDVTTTTTAPAPSAQTGPDADRHCAGRLHRHRKAFLSIAAQAVGISEADLRAALREGRSIAQVAESRGVAVQKVVDDLVAAARARLAEHVQTGRLTQARADEKVAALTARITEMVNRAGFPGHPGHPRGRGDAPAN